MVGNRSEPVQGVVGDVWDVLQPMHICTPLSGALEQRPCALEQRLLHFGTEDPHFGPNLYSRLWLVQRLPASVPFHPPFQKLSALQGCTVSRVGKGQ